MIKVSLPVENFADDLINEIWSNFKYIMHFANISGIVQCTVFILLYL